MISIIVFILFIFILLIVAPVFTITLLILIGLCFLIDKIYTSFYFKSEKFNAIKVSIQEYISDCNELNNHIEELRSSFANFKRIDYGEVNFQNISKRNYKKKNLSNVKYSPYIYDCSNAVCNSARSQPFKYVCKYFNMKENEETLNQIEQVLNNFSAAEEGKELSKKKRDEILSNISTSVPFWIRKRHSNRLQRELGFKEFIFDEIYFPSFSFRYISAGGNSGNQFDLTMDIPMLERFINYLADIIKFKKTTKYQRQLMTPKLRKQIIERDNKTCQNCGNSTTNEPNLLLEVDHIIPIAKGGITAEENLQTLCWKCNRTKGAKIS